MASWCLERSLARSQIDHVWSRPGLSGGRREIGGSVDGFGGLVGGLDVRVRRSLRWGKCWVQSAGGLWLGGWWADRWVFRPESVTGGQDLVG